MAARSLHNNNKAGTAGVCSTSATVPTPTALSACPTLRDGVAAMTAASLSASLPLALITMSSTPPVAVELPLAHADPSWVTLERSSDDRGDDHNLRFPEPASSLYQPIDPAVDLYPWLGPLSGSPINESAYWLLSHSPGRSLQLPCSPFTFQLDSPTSSPTAGSVSVRASDLLAGETSLVPTSPPLTSSSAECESLVSMRKLKHRSVDRSRRKREAEALRRLNAALSSALGGSTERCSDARRVRKVQLLDIATQRLAELQAVVRQMQQQQSALLSQQLQRFCHDVSGPLPFDRLFVCASLPMFVVSCPSGTIMELNTALLSICGREQMVGRTLDLGFFPSPAFSSTLTPTSPFNSTATNSTARSTHCQLSQGDDGHRILIPINGSRERLIQARKVAQDERSLAQLRDLCSGRVQRIQATWRAELEYDALYELRMTSWLIAGSRNSNSEPPSESHPQYIVFSFGWEDASRLK